MGGRAQAWVAVVALAASGCVIGARKLVVPPPALFDAMDSLERTADFAVLPSSIRAAP